MNTGLIVRRGGAIAQDGGTVVILPKAVDPGRAGDLGLGDDRQPQIVVAAQEEFSVVFFPYSRDGSYVYRFEPMDDVGQLRKSTTTLLLDVGSGAYKDPNTQQMVELPEILTLMVSGPAASERRSRENGVRLTELLRTGGLSCKTFGVAQVCAANDASPSGTHGRT